ncbi:MAG: hypothetical protein ISS74_01320 [Planctomycetes bacterium]|nr:hypothetical protein [Planctomycetota bacterium]
MTISRTPLWRWLIVLAAAGMLALGGCKTTPPEEGEGEKPPTPPPATLHADLLKLLPAAGDITNWKPEGEAQVFGPSADAQAGVEALEKDLGQAAEAFRAYAFASAAKRRYLRGQAGEAITLRVFRMKTPSEAFGIFSVRADGGQSPLVGLAARMSERALGFVKGAYFVTVEYAGAGDGTSALMEFGRWVADQITSPGYFPALLATFPRDSAPGERYYLHEFQTLSSLGFVPMAEPGTMARMLDLGPNTDVAIMGYPTTREGVLNYLFVIRYPSGADASAAYTAYRGYLEGSTSPAEHNVAVAPPLGAYVAGTFNAEENSINDRLAELVASLSG